MRDGIEANMIQRLGMVGYSTLNALLGNQRAAASACLIGVAEAGNGTKFNRSNRMASNETSRAKRPGGG
jgi:hypothetical protein